MKHLDTASFLKVFSSLALRSCYKSIQPDIIGSHPSSPACLPSGYFTDETQLADQQRDALLKNLPAHMNPTADPVPPQQRPWPRDENGLLYRPLKFRSPIKVDRKPSTVFWAEEYQINCAITRAESRMRILEAHFQNAQSDAALIDI